MSKAFEVHSTRKGIQADALRFLIGGERIGNDDTPALLGMEEQDWDQIECFLEQVPKLAEPVDPVAVAKAGDIAALRTLPTAALVAVYGTKGRTLARFLARRGFVSCLRALSDLGAGSTLSASAANGVTPAHSAAGGGHEECLRALYDMGAGASLSAATIDGATPAHWAAELGNEGCLRALYQLKAGASLSAATAKGRTPAHCAAAYGHEVRIEACGVDSY